MGQAEAEIGRVLEAMADKGLCVALKVNGIQFYQSARFMPGILEFQFMSGGMTERHKRIAALIHDYKKAFDEKSKDAQSKVAPYRVITVDRTVRIGNQVHTYDQVRSYIDKCDQIAVSTCYCRHAALLRGEDIHEMPTDVCMQFGINAQFAVERLGARKVTKNEALEVLNRSEEAGLIHMSQNVTDDIAFLCNCDRWHCVAVKAALSQARPGLYFNSGFSPFFDPDLCTACETCVDRCPPKALAMGEEDLPKVDLDRCFGCAACATGCPSEAITMTNKPDYPVPPKSEKDLKEALKASRGAP
jgi:Pyruvate/2-oxoacid:ferredoxin oxidoreductase delta subunit